MRLRWAVAIFVCVLSSTSWAQEEPKPEQLRKMYDDALKQLKEAQERRNELATQNEQLAKQVEDLKKQLDASTALAAGLQERVDAHAEESFKYRSTLAAWEVFLNLQPVLRAKWKVFLEREPLSVPSEPPVMLDPNWPISAEG